MTTARPGQPVPAATDPRSTGLVFDALDNPIAVLDRSGQVVAVNQAWNAASESGRGDTRKTGVGANYLTVCDRAAGPGAEGAAEIAEGIRAVLRGDQDRFAVDYPCHSPVQERWFHVRVSPLGEGDGVVVIHHDITEVRLAEQRAQRDEARLLRALDESAPVFVLLDPDGTVAHVSEQTSELVGRPRHELIGADAFAFVEPVDRDRVWEIFERTAAVPGERSSLTCRLSDGHGRWRHVELTVVNLLEEPDVRSVVVTGVDVTDTRLHQIARRLEGPLLQRFPAAVAVTDDRGVLVYWNERAAAMFGIDAGTALGRKLRHLGVRSLDPALDREIVRTVRAEGSWEGDYDLALPDGRVLPLHTLLEWVDDDDIDFHGMVAASIDVTERRRLQQELAFQALHDPLTGLPNRRNFVGHLEQVLARCGDSGRVAVAFIDLDDFKVINDRIGHGVGDQALRVIGERIGAVLRDADVVARIGGDEFVVGFADVSDADEAMDVAGRLLEAVGRPFAVDGHRLQVSATIGVALSQDGSGAEQLLRNADAAMYVAKEGGKDRIELFDDVLREATKVRREFAERLRDAVEQGRIHAHYQPQICLRTGDLMGFEALARWTGDDPAFERSAAFLEVAEESGVSTAIDREILEQSCQALARFHRERPDLGCSIAVNVSAELLGEASFAPLVRSLVEGAGFPPRLLCIEVVESALADVDAVAETLANLEALGVEVAIDDFGTGYSSLSRLQQLRVDYLKIDQGFVAGMGSERDDGAVVSAIIGLARALGLRTIAEGVETDAQVDHLLQLGVDIGQGFRWSAAVPFDEALEVVRAAETSGTPCEAPDA